MRFHWILIASAFVVSLASQVAADTPLGPSFTYQGSLKQGGHAFTGTANFVFTAYDAATGGFLVGSQTVNGVAVNAGLFTVQLNLGNAFYGRKRWLEITVNGTVLTPRQELTATPYALFSTLPWVTSGTDITYASGNVGIGTNTPVALLDVEGFGSASAGTIYGLQTAGPANGAGVYGKSDVAGSNGVIGEANGSNAYGVWGISDVGNGVVGQSTSGFAGYFTGKSYFGGNVGIGTVTPAAPLDVQGGASDQYGTLHVVQTAGSAAGTAIYGQSNISGGVGVYGQADGALANGVLGNSTAGHGVEGYSHDSFGVYAFSQSSNAVEGEAGSASAFAVFALGRLGASGTKSMRIDHPLDPENKYLLHYCSEGPQPMNAYSGRVALDVNGEAWVDLPDYFAEINTDPRVQLTAFGAAMPNLHVATDVQDNHFQIAGGASNGQVFWRVEAVRNDRWVRAYGAPVETDKPAAERGKYQHPELYGQPAELGVQTAKLRATASPQ